MSNRPLSQMSNEELWRLFPVVIRDYNADYPRWFADEAADLSYLLHLDAGKLHHIGSTAVPGLAAKPTIDLLLELEPGTDLAQLRETLETAGWIFCPRPDQLPPGMMFLKGYTPDGFADKVFHLHLRYGHDHDEIYFRDYLLKHPETAKQYAALKRQLQRQYEFDRDAYTANKGDFVRRVTRLARGQN